ncbi:MAG: class I SAM-dependent methyltransferase [Armatimonadota bacterium]|nr:class I SAM-dependent methyltransferase [Armatimonadota bacterium]MDR7427553.1 class I SAM-dependent methyltransferase [Armatimonadota bacterium]MDR7463437.1 class I SAM-dependent methyltransferase [Armatimonadota bacterium]MDR7469717.1 class I SAM-dependent methyltransferase [Armatimonadota bacterium]MDR7473950.1 class I SAM-dependent methyltransferase [Armatimonadota bacterium]
MPVHRWTLRRRLLDDHLKQAAPLVQGIVLDVGGERVGYRGRFRPPRGVRWVYANLDLTTRPDIVCDAHALGIRDEAVDAVVCVEVLEHVANPRAVLAEIHRVLRPRGTLLLATPFLYRLHGDPYDYQRVTDHWLYEVLGQLGFRVVHLARQGAFFTVVADMVHQAVTGAAHRWIRALFTPPLLAIQVLCPWLDRRLRAHASPLLSSFTTGFFVVAIRDKGKRDT